MNLIRRTKATTPQHIIITKLLKCNDKEKNLKRCQRKINVQEGNNDQNFC